jgi:hypothetical protein
MTQIRTLHGSALSVIAAMTNGDLARAAGYRSVAGLVPDLVRITPQRIVEKHLVDLARDTNATTLRTHGEALLARLNPDGDQPSDDTLAEPINAFRYRRDRSGRMHFTGDINPETAEELDAMLGALAKPDGPTDHRHHTHRLGDAFCDVVHHAIGTGVSGLPVRSGEKPHLNLTIDYSQLLDSVGSATLESGAPLPAAAARRLACDCGIIPVVLNGASVPLDVGRTRRLVTIKQRTALNIRDHGCTFPHCERPARWADGGSTRIRFPNGI